jgi:apolipoprotein N-acyltransferase
MKSNLINQKSNKAMKKLIFLVITIIVYYFSHGEPAHILGIILAPTLILALIDNIKNKTAAVFLVLSIVYGCFIFQWRNYIQAPMPFYLIIALGNALIFYLPYVFYIFIKKEKNNALTYMTIPLGCVLVEYLVSSLSPFASWGSVAYDIPNINFLNQIASVTGIYGISFIFRLSSVVIYLFFKRLLISKGYFKTHISKAEIAVFSVFLVSLVSICIFGFVRLKTDLSGVNARLAGVTVPLSKESIIYSNIDYKKEFGSMLTRKDQLFLEIYLLNKKVADTDMPMVNQWFRSIQDKLLKETESAINQGAKLVVWSEGNGVCLKENEDIFINRCQELAKNRRAYLLVSLGSKTIGQKNSENKTIAIDTNGVVQYSSLKNFPVPGAENSVKGDAVIKIMNTHFGKVSSVICFDADFPNLVRQTSKLNTSILFVPGYDWAAIVPYHTNMIKFRAIENGIMVFRQVNTGLSAVYNPLGIMGNSKYFDIHSKDAVFIQDFTISKINTIYNKIGDAFAFLCIVCLCSIFLMSKKIQKLSDN